MASIPEYSIKDMVGWFRLVAGNQPRLLSGLQVGFLDRSNSVGTL